MVTATKASNPVAKKDKTSARKTQSKTKKDNGSDRSEFQLSGELKHTVAQIEKQFGEGAIMPSSESVLPNSRRRPSAARAQA